jgi:hypothetical protein
VLLKLLGVLWNGKFIDEQGRGFDEVKDTVSEEIPNFSVYVEHLRFLVEEIYPQIT